MSGRMKMIIASLGILFIVLLIGGGGLLGYKKYNKMIKNMESQIEERIKADYAEKVAAKDTEIIKLKAEKADLLKKIKAKTSELAAIKPSGTIAELKKSFKELGYENH